MTEQALFEAALDAARNWHATVPAARDFCAFPEDTDWQARAPHPLKAADLLITDPGRPNEASAPLLSALQAVVPFVEWRHGYTADEVGQDFLDRFCWFELAGPDGHFITQSARLTVGYWGPGLHYPRHDHVAEELYTVVSGTALFQSDGDPDARLGPESSRFHHSNQSHALVTEDHPILTFVFWRGQDLAAMPTLTAS